MRLRLLLIALLGVATLSGCGSDDEKGCMDGGKIYRPGDVWTCSDDGCNLCRCYADGSMGHTLMACRRDAGTTDAADGG